MPKTTVIAVRVSVETKAALRALAAEDRRALSNYVNKLLEDHVEDATASRTLGDGTKWEGAR